MLTIFSTPKPFEGHVGIIQRNAINSWLRLDKGVEVILVGDDMGTAEVCAELGIGHLREVRRNARGTKYLASVYDQAQDAARHNFLCHVNCDIVLMGDFALAASKMIQLGDRFLMAGRRWDVDITEPLDFRTENWRSEVRQLALRTNRQRPPQWIDYFMFPKGLFSGKIPNFVIGRPGWDNWLIWYALSAQVPVFDASDVVVAAHQNHNYGYHPEGEQGVWYGDEAQQNYTLLRIYGRHETLESATYLLRPDGIKRNYRALWAKLRRAVTRGLFGVWFWFLEFTRPARKALGLTSTTRSTRLRIRSGALILWIGIILLLGWVCRTFIRPY